ncbi:MAG: hypothetical protein ACREB8_04785 [Pseudolabrys sp.]
MAIPPPSQPRVQPKMTYVDRPEISDIFADGLRRATFDGINTKLEFVINRMDEHKPPAPPTGQSLTACRLVLPIPCVLELHGKLSQLINALHAQGVIKQTSTGDSPELDKRKLTTQPPKAT